jgi:aspartyl-tRNA(Asn)/glutamyl-tRNA(Gln) amidotransferase subunit A
MARTIRDCALLLNAMAGYDSHDPASVEHQVPDFTAELERGARGIRVGVPTNNFTEQVQPDVLSAWRQAVADLESLGAGLVEVSVTTGLYSPGASPARMAEAAAFHQQWLDQRPGDYGDDVRASLQAAGQASAIEYVSGERGRFNLLLEMRELFERIDVLVTPTLPITATRIGEREVELDGQRVPVSPQLIRFTLPFNQTGYPAASVPCGFDRDGLPIGLQIAGRPWEESTVVRVAHAYQQSTDWHRRRPALGALG